MEEPFTHTYEYDSWNRMLSLAYPDGERVHYTYNQAGDLQKMTGDKNGNDRFFHSSEKMKVVASPFISFSASTFTGKETDCETGFSYFGARYYDPTLLTSWTAVDPMSDKYPNLSPYNYCAWNPMKLVDPDGKKIKGVKYVNGEYQYSRWAIKNGTDKYINVRSQTKTGRENINRMLSDKKTFRLMVTDKPLFRKTKQGFGRLGGFRLNNDIVVSTNLNKSELGQGYYIYEQNPDGTYYDSDHIFLQKYNFTEDDSYISGLSIEEEQQILDCYRDAPLYELSTEEKINCLGAHEEAHLLDGANESEAIEAECNAKREWDEK